MSDSLNASRSFVSKDRLKSLFVSTSSYELRKERVQETVAKEPIRKLVTSFKTAISVQRQYHTSGTSSQAKKMPRKGDKRKGRRTRASTTPVPQPASVTQNTKSSPPTRGRKTKNSQKGRQPPPKPATGGKRTSNGRGVRRKLSEQQTTFTSHDQIVYKSGGT